MIGFYACRCKQCGHKFLEHDEGQIPECPKCSVEED